MASTTVETRVRYGETDQMGVAYHAHYLVWCELARTEHMRRLGVRYRDFEERGFKLAVSEASLRYSRSAHYDDLLQVTAWLAEVGSRLVVFEYTVERDGALLCTARTALVCLNRDNKPVRMPPDVLAIMESSTP